MRLNYIERHFKVSQFTNELKLKDGTYNGYYQGTPALIKIKDGEATSIMFYGGVMDGRGLLKSGIELLIESGK